MLQRLRHCRVVRNPTRRVLKPRTPRSPCTRATQRSLASLGYSHADQAAQGWRSTIGLLPTMVGGPVTAYMAQRYFKP
jgi:hypothetical protein